jgi:BirA family transcriptional regulator, biotin operon repressor / biotin---[acetyl-CoA-carboxylase] ligase
MQQAGGTGQINPTDVNRALQHTRLGGSVLHFPEVESTQTLALEAARAGVPQGVWVADEQTAGRGRGGHTWHSAPGDGLYLTALFTPKLPAFAYRLTLAAGLAAWEAIREVAGVTADLRWPNDLVTRPGVHPRARKLGGILVESAVASATAPYQVEGRSFPMLRYVVIGIGINVGHTAFPPKLAQAATSLRLEGWTDPNRQALLITLLTRLELAVHELEASFTRLRPGPPTWPDLLEASTWVQGKHVHVSEDGGYTGVTDGLTAEGFLRVLSEGGETRVVRSGGVREP